MLKGLLIWAVKFLLGIALLGLVFSVATPQIPELIQGAFSGIYDHASGDAQARMVGVAESFCLQESDPRQGSVIRGIKLCNDNEMRAALEQDCRDFRAGKSDFEIIGENEDPGETCDAVEKGSLDEFCSKISANALMPDFEYMKKICGDYRSKTLDGKGLFLGMIGSLFSNMDISKLPFLAQKPILGYLFEMHLIVYAVLTLLLLALLAFLLDDHSLLIKSIASMIFGMSFFLLLPYIGIIAYEHYNGIETDSLLTMFSEEGNANPSPLDVLGLLLIVLKSMYTKTLLAVAIAFFIIGLAGKIYYFRMKRKSQAAHKKK